MIILSCDHLTGINFSPRAEFSSSCNISSIEGVALAVPHCSNLSNKTDNIENEWWWSVSVLNGNVFIRWWGDGNLNLCRPDGGRIAAGVVVLLVHKIQSQTITSSESDWQTPAFPSLQSRNGFPWMWTSPCSTSWEDKLAPHTKRTRSLFPYEAFDNYILHTEFY